MIICIQVWAPEQLPGDKKKHGVSVYAIANVVADVDFIWSINFQWEINK